MEAHQFDVSPLNAHYEGEYSDRQIEWRRLGAIDKAAHIAEMLAPSLSISSVLEVGCGTGAVLAEVRRLGIGSSHVGVDMADPEQHRDAWAEGLDMKTYDGKTLPFADDSFDLVYASHVLEHVPDERGFLAEMRRVAKVAVFLEVPCELHMRTNYKAMQETLNIGHINAYTPESFLLTLATSDLTVEALNVFDHSDAVHGFHTSKVKGRLKGLLRRTALRANPTLATRIFTYHCGALCRPSALARTTP